MKTNYLEIQEVHTWQAYKNEVYIGLKVYDVALDCFTNVTLKIPASTYLEDIAGDFKEVAKETYKKHIDTL